MTNLIVQAGGGVYARLQASPVGPVRVEFGEVAGGAFFASGKEQRVYAPLYDGFGWDMMLVQRLIRHLRPLKAESEELTKLLANMRKRYPVDLREYVLKTTKDPYDWERIAALLRRCAEYGLISEPTLQRYARNGYPLMVRQAAQLALAAAI